MRGGKTGENIFLAKISTYTVANNIIIMNIVYINTCRHLHSMGEYYVDGGEGRESSICHDESDYTM